MRGEVARATWKGGALGLATMWAAVFGDVGVALIAVLNAMRVMKAAKD
jgi:Cd2+/Zn2+-exporting ATPase